MGWLQKLGKAIGSTLDNVVHDPLPTLVGAVAMMYGVPPVYAGAMSGATGAAIHGGDVLKGALTGGVLGYVGQTTSTYLAGTGVSPVIVGAGTGAALGVAGTALSGGKSMALNAMTGAAIGAIAGYYQSPKTKSQTYSYDDGSTLTKYADGTFSATPAGTVDSALSQTNPPPAALSEVFTSTDAIIGDTSTASLTSTGLINPQGASILADSGYTPSQIEMLINGGYTPNELINMASTGVTGDVLTSLSNTQFAESSINELLSNNVSASEIANASDLVNAGKLDSHAATSLLRHGVDSIGLVDLADSGLANQASYLMDKGVSFDAVQQMISEGVSLNYANNEIGSGRVTSQQVNSNAAQGTLDKVLEVPKIAQPVQPPVVAQPVAPVAPVETVSQNIPDYAIKTKIGNEVRYYDPMTGDVYRTNGELDFQAMNMADVSPEKIGVKTADAQKVINDVTHPQTVSDAGTGETPFRVDIGGRAGSAESPDVVLNEHRTPGTNLATIEQIDNGDATWNPLANAWEIRTDIVPSVPPIESSVGTVGNVPVTPQVPIDTSSTITQPPPVNLNNQIIDLKTFEPNLGEVVPTTPVNPNGDPNVNAVITPANPATQPSNQQVANVDITKPVSPPPVVTPLPVVTPPPLTPLTPVEVTPSQPIPNVDLTKPPVVEPPVPVEPPVTQPEVKVPNPPLADETQTPVDTTHYGTYSWGNAPMVNAQKGLNPGWIEPPTYYQTTNPAQSQYYWGEHPYQAGNTFNKQLYNTLPNAPATPWGATHAQTAATPAQILAAMQQLYPNLGTQTVTGPVVPVR